MLNNEDDCELHDEDLDTSGLEEDDELLGLLLLWLQEILLEEDDLEDVDKLLLEQLEDREFIEELQLDDKEEGELFDTLLLEEPKEKDTLDDEEDGDENI